jgi:hypothetical protein
VREIKRVSKWSQKLWKLLKGVIECGEVPVFQLGTESSVLFLNVTNVIKQKRLHQPRTLMHVEVIMIWDSPVGIVTLCRIDDRNTILFGTGNFPFTTNVCIRC